jgi:hypothetical protein
MTTEKQPAGLGLSEVLGHTLGPWYAATADEWRTASGEHTQWGRFDISAGSNDPEAETYYRICSVSNVNNSPQNQANAKLIAAAPKLGHALRDLVDVMTGRMDGETVALHNALAALRDAGLMA